MRLFRLLSFLISILITIHSFGQEPDPESSALSKEQIDSQHKSQHSPDSALVQYYYLNTDASYTIHDFSKPLRNFQEYKIISKGDHLFVNTGTIGSASLPLFFDLNLSPEFIYKTDVFKPFRLHSDSIRIYKSASPYSHLKYIMGKAKEQRLDFEISQRLGPGLYTGLTLRYANAPGIYLRQRTYYPGGSFYVAYAHPKQRYNAIATFLSDKFTNYENGGIKDKDVFASNAESNRKTILVNLANAYNSSKVYQFTLQHSYMLSKSKVVIDSLPSPKRRFDLGQFVHTLKFSSEGNGFSDISSNPSFYPHIYSDSSNIFDTVHIKTFENTFAYTNMVPDTSQNAFPFQYSFRIKNSVTSIYTDSAENKFTQWIPMVTLKGIIGSKTFFKADGALSIGGYNNGDFMLSGNFYQYFGKNKNIINLILTQSHNHPEYYFIQYATNTFMWDNNFNTIEISKASLDVKINGYDVNAGLSRVQNYVYLDKTITPKQYEKGILLAEMNFSKQFTSRHWLADMYAHVQKVIPDTIITMPLFIGKASIYYDIILFKKALHAQIGVSATYHTTWKAQAYMPVLRSFYQQDSYVAGNYPYADAFINLNVKRARMFFKYEHFNSFFSGYRYIIISGYPQDDAGFKFGISWVFFD